MIAKKKNGMSIFVRILIAFMCVNIATTGILMVIAFAFHRQSIEKRTKETVTQQLETLRDNFENDYRLNLKKSLDTLVSSSILDDYLTTLFLNLYSFSWLRWKQVFGANGGSP